MNKKILLIPMFALIGSSLIACGKNGGGKGGNIEAEDGKATLNITYARMGYGDSWLKAICSKYNEETGVGFKFSSRIGIDGVSAINTEIESKNSNSDLIFTKRGLFAEDIYSGKTKINGVSYDCIYEDISDVWNRKPNGESKTIKEKMNIEYEDYFNFDGKYYGLPWANGLMGIVRNLRLWNSYGFTDEDIPLTTNEMLALSNEIQTTKDKKAAWIYSFQDEYYTPIANVFVGQYEGVDVMEENFLKGKDPDGIISPYFYTYDGQNRSLEFLRELITKYQHPQSKSMEFTLMQSSFLLDEAMFSINGSWLESEMGTSDRYATIDVIKFPVISAITEKMSIKDDTDKDSKLHDLIQYVDDVDNKKADATKPAWATDSDLKIVTEARHYAYLSSGCDHQCFIPVYSKNIDVAKDFLTYFYSDESLDIYHKTMNGGTLPAECGKAYSPLDNETTPFRNSINAALESGYLYAEMPKAKFFSLGEVNFYYQNGIDGLTKAFVNGNTVDYVLNANTEYITKRWQSIQTKLGLN